MLSPSVHRDSLCGSRMSTPSGHRMALYSGNKHPAINSVPLFGLRVHVYPYWASNGLFRQQPPGSQPCRGSFLRHSRLIENHIKRWRSTAMRRAWHVIHKHRAKARGTADAVNSYLWATLQPAHRRALRSFEFNCDICIRASPLDPASENDDAINSNIPRRGI